MVKLVYCLLLMVCADEQKCYSSVLPKPDVKVETKSRSKNVRLSQQNYMEIDTLILKGIENMNITSKEGYHQLAPDLKICRIVNGMWQVAGGHGYIDHELAIEDMMIKQLDIK